MECSVAFWRPAGIALLARLLEDDLYALSFIRRDWAVGAFPSDPVDPIVRLLAPRPQDQRSALRTEPVFLLVAPRRECHCVFLWL